MKLFTIYYANETENNFWHIVAKNEIEATKAFRKQFNDEYGIPIDKTDILGVYEVKWITDIKDREYKLKLSLK